MSDKRALFDPWPSSASNNTLREYGIAHPTPKRFRMSAPISRRLRVFHVRFGYTFAVEFSLRNNAREIRKYMSYQRD